MEELSGLEHWFLQRTLCLTFSGTQRHSSHPIISTNNGIIAFSDLQDCSIIKRSKLLYYIILINSYIIHTLYIKYTIIILKR